MTTYYVGPSSAGAADGSSWANRLGTLNSAEDKPVAANDTVIVGAGVYRELLTIDVSGTAGNPITYIADVDGHLTDGVGGIVRITGSDNDTTATRASCITATSRNYRTFRGFTFDTTTAIMVSLITACSNWIVEDCFFAMNAAAAALLSFAGTGTTNTVRRCVFMGVSANMLIFTHGVAVDNSANVVENCILQNAVGFANLAIVRVGGVAVRHCLVTGGSQGIRVVNALTTGQTTTVNNCIIARTATGFQAATAPGTNEEITENYNNVYSNGTDRTNVSTGANSNTFPPLFAPPMLLSGYKYPWNPFDLSQWSALRRLAGTGMSSDGLYGMARPATDSKKSWGAVQFVDVARETTTKRTGAVSLKLADAGRHQMFVPITNVSTTISCYVQWEADYAGTKPSMVIKQPGQSDTTDTATGSSGTWEELSITLTPAASPGYVIVELVSNNTGSGSIATYFDDLTVT